MKPKLLLIDGDLYAYKYAAAAEKSFDWGDGLTTLVSDGATAFANMKADIDHTLVTLQADRILVCLSDDVNFRKGVYPEYKSNRKDVRKPMALATLKEMMEEEYEVFRRPTLEADDVMGIIATNPMLFPTYEKIIVSRDKDMKTIPSTIWNETLDKEGKPFLQTQTPEEADLYHRMQTLTGDTADGYPGCRKVGPVKAAKIAPLGWDAVREAFLDAGHDEEFFLSQARCARILHATDYDYVKKEPILWTPPQSSP
jgi:DNA polymerase-1